ncbi:hypothetical protein [Desulfobacter latus]|uniref:Uncharacterized protein n=1 Tax=Desulfobacter latus TaxID=2292 RepID=A0A850T7C4_9BACT|nr:hypothetical protein [Desulfobacter latus]NWH04288.1 hypothetical protein [Desulfobacter latus]
MAPGPLFPKMLFGGIRKKDLIPNIALIFIMMTDSYFIRQAPDHLCPTPIDWV